MAATAEPVAAAIGRRFIGTYCRRALRRQADLHVEGLHHLPSTGPVLLAARHVHHLLDGCALVTTIQRPVHIVVALDWTKSGRDRRVMSLACGSLRWPTVLRHDSPAPVDPREAVRLLRRASRDAVTLLRDGRVLLVFPEGYPNVDPHPTPKPDLDAFLPFRPGFVRLAALAERDGRTRVAIVPTGFTYERGDTGWRMTLRFDPPRYLERSRNHAAFARDIEARVRVLSEGP